MTGILTLKGYGFTENEILDMPLDKYVMYINAANELDNNRRRGVVIDTSAAIGGSFSGGVADYVNSAFNGD